jgi:hypothetical protein
MGNKESTPETEEVKPNVSVISDLQNRFSKKLLSKKIIESESTYMQD